MARSKQGRGECNSVERSAIRPFFKHRWRTEHHRVRSAIVSPRLGAWVWKTPLVARCGLGASGLRNADVAGHFVLANLVHDHFQRAAIIALMEEDRFVYRQVLLVEVHVVDAQ